MIKVVNFMIYLMKELLVQLVSGLALPSVSVSECKTSHPFLT